MQIPNDCNTMTELRGTIDTFDAEIMSLLSKRAECIDRAITLKSLESLPARIDDRVEYVAMRARENAVKLGFDPDLAENIWRQLIEWSIEREEAVLGTEISS